MTAAAAKPSAPMVTVLVAGTCCGFVMARGPAGFEAFDDALRSLGLFATEREAVASVLERRPAP